MTQPPSFQSIIGRAAEASEIPSDRSPQLTSAVVRTLTEAFDRHRQICLPHLGTLVRNKPVSVTEHEKNPPHPDELFERVRLPIPIGDQWKSNSDDPDVQALKLWESQQPGLDNERAEAFWNRLWKTVREDLLEHGAVQIPDSGTFRLDEPEPDAEGGTVRFIPEDSTETRDSNRTSFTFAPHPSFRRTLRELETARKNVLLLVPEGDLFFEMMEPTIEEKGYSVSFRHDAEDTLDELNDGSLTASALLVDSRLQHAQSFMRSVGTNPFHADLPVVLIFPEDVDPSHPEQLQVFGDDEIQEPFDVHALLSLIEQLDGPRDPDLLHHVHFRFPTRNETVEDAQQFLDRLIEQSNVDDETQVEMRAAFREAIGNAAQHGNRYRRDKKILCDYSFKRDEITFQVEDEGRGFDHEKYVRQGQSDDALDHTREGHQEGKYGGFGIMLMLRTVDDVEYNEKGNVVTLIKNRTTDESDTS